MKKLTHEEYLQKLLDKNIKIIPLEEYSGTHNKILHKCECGDTWEVTPGKVTTGRKCPECWKIRRVKINNEIYNNRLLEHNSSLRLKEGVIYKNKMRLSHICSICDREILSRTDNYCSCPHCIDRGWKRTTYKNRETVIYYIKINQLYKIGIKIIDVNKNLEDNIFDRYKTDIKHNGIEVKILKTKLIKDGSILFDLERKIKREVKEYRYNGIKFLGHKKKGGGESEMYTVNIFDKIKEYFE